MPIKWFEFNFNSLTFLNDKWIHCTVATFHCFSSSFYDGVQAQYAKHSTSFKSQRFNTVNERKQTSIFVTFSHHWVCTLVAHYWYIWIDLKENKNTRRNKFGLKRQISTPSSTVTFGPLPSTSPDLRVCHALKVSSNPKQLKNINVPNVSDME